MILKKDARTINFPMLFKVLGWLLMIESAFMAMPMAVALCYGEADWQSLMVGAALALVAGYLLNHLVRPSSSNMAKREGFLLTAMVWIVFSLFGMVPFVLCEQPLSVVDAFFEAMAGFTTTGVTAYVVPETLSHGINFWRALMQWLGGLGIIIFTLAVIPMLNHSGGMQMFNAEVTGITHDKIRPRVSQTAMSLWAVYIALTLLCCLALWAGPMTLFDSVCHAMGTVSTGGFTTASAGVSQWASTYADVVVIVFMVLGGANFSLIFFAATGHLKPLRHNVTLRAYGCLLLAYFVLMAIDALRSGCATDVQSAVVYPLMQTVATVTSTGYVVPHLPLWGSMAMALMVPMMFFGACAGSTSGGAKIDRLVVLTRYLKNSLIRALQPNKVTSVSVDGKVLPTDTVNRTISFLCLYVIMGVVAAIALTAMGVDVGAAFFSSLSCMTNLGLGTDALGYGSPIPLMPAGCKMVLAAVMLIGRLEIMTIIVIFTPAFWNR